MATAAAFLDGALAWQAIAALARASLARDSLTPAHGFKLTEDGLTPAPADNKADLILSSPGPASWHCPGGASAEAAWLLDLYLPVVVLPARGAQVVAHLGQSLDGRIATVSGDSHYVTGAANLDHLHRLRALGDAVVVGSGTLKRDDPRLTTRRIAGPDPLRCILAGRQGLAGGYAALGAGALVLVPESAGAAGPGETATIAVAERAGRPEPGAVIDALSAQGCRRIFVEGGAGVVSSFLQADCLDRLQLCIAPIILGSGQSSLELPPITDLAAARRPATRRFDMGDDVLFDCALAAGS